MRRMLIGSRGSLAVAWRITRTGRGGPRTSSCRGVGDVAAHRVAAAHDRRVAAADRLAASSRDPTRQEAGEASLPGDRQRMIRF